MVATTFVKHRGYELEVLSSQRWVQHTNSLPGCLALLSMSLRVPGLYVGAVPGGGSQCWCVFPSPRTRSMSDHCASSRSTARTATLTTSTAQQP